MISFWDYESTDNLCWCCRLIYLCPTTTTACSGPVYPTTVSSTQADVRMPESKPIDDQINNVMLRIHWSHKRQWQLIRDTRKYVLITAPRRLQRGRNR